MSQEAIFEKVRSIVAEQLSVDAAEVKPESNFQNDLGADSLDTVELVMALEEAFDIEIPDEAAEGITTVGDAVKYIQDKQARSVHGGGSPPRRHHWPGRGHTDRQRHFPVLGRFELGPQRRCRDHPV